MANHQPRAQRLRVKRKARSAELRHYTKVLSHDFMHSKPDKAEWKQARKLGIVDEKFKAKYGEDPYEVRQAKREQEHLKRNKRKQGEGKRIVRKKPPTPQELKQRNILLNLPATRPESMSPTLWKGLLKERSKLFKVSNPPTRGIPNYSPKVVPARKKPTRFQEAYVLAEGIVAKVGELAQAADKYGSQNLFWSQELQGYRLITGVKRISHFD